MKLLLDTHVFLWAAAGDDRLPPAVRRALAADESQLLVSVASLWEIASKAADGRLFQWTDPTDEDQMENWVRRLGAEVLPISAGHATKAWKSREWLHKDPFDRMIATQAVEEGATLVTADPAFRNCPGLKWFWDVAAAP